MATFDPRGRLQLTPLFDERRRVATEHGAGLIFTDTLADAFSGSENDRSQARAFVQMALGALARETGAAVGWRSPMPRLPAPTATPSGAGRAARRGG
jgi:replicative DNA helicase